MKLLDRVREKMRLHHEAWATKQSYTAWIKRYIIFHKRGCEWGHLRELGAVEGEQFLSDLADVGRVSASTQN